LRAAMMSRGGTCVRVAPLRLRTCASH
jgi:hypothetical protein